MSAPHLSHREFRSLLPAVSAALQESDATIGLLIDGEPVFGCVHLPPMKETTYAGTAPSTPYCVAVCSMRRSILL
jgi:hypothetical protein